MTTTLDFCATVIADSHSEAGHRLITLEATYPRFVHAELMTHRDFSRNAASSRAIPVARMLERIEQNPSYPVAWPAEKAGMQGGDELSGEERVSGSPSPRERAQREWANARYNAVYEARRLTELGLHKSLTNRILEPWAWITTIITSSQWENFFAQRATSRTPLAQPELARIADMMEAAIDASTPTLVTDGWHLPYIDGDDKLQAVGLAKRTNIYPSAIDILRQVSVARCARVSLLNHDGTRELTADMGLYEKLTTAKPMHASPLEHVATPDPTNVQEVAVIDRRGEHPHILGYRTVPKIGNLLGWAQLRHMVEDSR